MCNNHAIICKNNTKIRQEGNAINNLPAWTIVKLLNTDIVKFNTQEIILNFGGYDSVTTPLRMNQVSNQLGLGYSVYRNKGNTFVDYKGETFEYQGYKMLFNRDTGGFNHVSDDRGQSCS